MKRLAVGICALVIATMVQMPLPAQADTYRYWSYWVGGDSWSYSSRGPGFRVPPDGGVEGWRFVVSPKDGSQASPPAAASTYEQLCRGQPPAPEGQKRVVVVIDPGPAGIAPVGETPPQRTTREPIALPQQWPDLWHRRVPGRRVPRTDGVPASVLGTGHHGA